MTEDVIMGSSLPYPPRTWSDRSSLTSEIWERILPRLPEIPQTLEHFVFDGITQQASPPYEPFFYHQSCAQDGSPYPIDPETAIALAVDIHSLPRTCELALDGLRQKYSYDLHTLSLSPGTRPKPTSENIRILTVHPTPKRANSLQRILAEWHRDVRPWDGPLANLIDDPGLATIPNVYTHPIWTEYVEEKKRTTNETEREWLLRGYAAASRYLGLQYYRQTLLLGGKTDREQALVRASEYFGRTALRNLIERITDPSFANPFAPDLALIEQGYLPVSWDRRGATILIPPIPVE